MYLEIGNSYTSSNKQYVNKMCFRSNDEELNRTMAGPISLRPFVFLTCVYGVTMKLCLRTSNGMHNVQTFLLLVRTEKAFRSRT